MLSSFHYHDIGAPKSKKYFFLSNIQGSESKKERHYPMNSDP
jgi:hypothetical protein